MRRAIVFGVALLAVPLIAVSLAGCVGPATSGTQTEIAADLTEPTFSGPFADEYTEAWRGTDSELVRTIINDEVITDQEWSLILTELTTCLGEKGITIDKYNDDGSYEADVGDQDGEAANEFLSSCEEESGEVPVGWLYRSQTTNPDNTPETELLTDCLIRNGAVPPTYTEEEYLEDAPEFEFPFIDERGYETLQKCTADSSVVL